MEGDLAREVVRELVQQTRSAKEEDQRATELYNLAKELNLFIQQIAPEASGDWGQVQHKEFARLELLAKVYDL